MPFQKGRAKTGGRAKGVPNKINLDVRARLDELECDPLVGMAMIAVNENNPLELRARMYAELAMYVYVKRKGIEHSGEVAVKRLIGISVDEL